MRLVVTPDAEDAVRSHGGEVWIRARGSRCCRATTWTLDATTDSQEGDFRRLAYDDLSVLVPAHLVEPDFLELEIDRRGRLRAYWNGQGWIG
jgi:hypothetical protein